MTEVELCAGTLPGRKRPCLYTCTTGDVGLIEVLAFFKDQAAVAAFLALRPTFRPVLVKEP